jgi:hypothetical protein
MSRPGQVTPPPLRDCYSARQWIQNISSHCIQFIPQDPYEGTAWGIGLLGGLNGVLGHIPIIPATSTGRRNTSYSIDLAILPLMNRSVPQHSFGAAAIFHHDGCARRNGGNSRKPVARPSQVACWRDLPGHRRWKSKLGVDGNRRRRGRQWSHRARRNYVTAKRRTHA